MTHQTSVSQKSEHGIHTLPCHSSMLPMIALKGPAFPLHTAPPHNAIADGVEV